jgi:hypothetical protein
VLTIIDTFSRFSPALEPRFAFRGVDVVEVLERVGLQTMKSERIVHWTKMRQFSRSVQRAGISVHARSLVDFITNMCGFEFSVHTGLRIPLRANGPDGDDKP